jgi:digeranylgeranylglycerophospholipid reductase
VKYDLIIVGAGPGGLMAARTAAREGLKTLVLEKKKEAARIRRYCTQMLKVAPTGFSSAKTPTDVKIERVKMTFEVDYGQHVLHLKNLDTKIDYKGELGAYYNETWVSPSGHFFNTMESSDDLYGFQIDKEALLTGLLEEATGAGCELRTSTKCLDIEDGPGGAKLIVSTGAGEETLEASRVIIADGAFSPLITKLGFEDDRPRGAPSLKFLAYTLDRVDSSFPESRHLKFAVPSLHKGQINLGRWTRGRVNLSASTSMAAPADLTSVLNRFMTESPFAGWFAKSKVVDRLGCNMPLVPPVEVSARGNIIALGDNVAYAETAMKGALGCGFKAALASKQALAGEDGNAAYNEYWQHAFSFFSPQYRSFGKQISPPPRVLDDAGVDALYQWLQVNDLWGMPGDVLTDNMARFQAELPEVAAKVIVGGGASASGSHKA